MNCQVSLSINLIWNHYLIVKFPCVKFLPLASYVTTYTLHMIILEFIIISNNDTCIRKCTSINQSQQSLKVSKCQSLRSIKTKEVIRQV